MCPPVPGTMVNFYRWADPTALNCSVFAALYITLHCTHINPYTVLVGRYDFFVYSMLNATLSKVFFPSNNPTVQQVSFWGVFFVGFVARPIGSVVFGHM